MLTNRFRRLSRDESGMTYVFIGLGMMAFLSASMLAIDVGMLMTARSQAQNSADAGALGGATALIFDDYDDRTATGPAVTTALDAARGNQVMTAERLGERARRRVPQRPVRRAEPRPRRPCAAPRPAATRCRR